MTSNFILGQERGRVRGVQKVPKYRTLYRVKIVGHAKLVGQKRLKNVGRCHLWTFPKVHQKFTKVFRNIGINAMAGFSICPQGQNVGQTFGVGGVHLAALTNTVFPHIVSSLELFPPLNSFRTQWGNYSSFHYIRCGIPETI